MFRYEPWSFDSACFRPSAFRESVERGKGDRPGNHGLTQFLPKPRVKGVSCCSISELGGAIGVTSWKR